MSSKPSQEEEVAPVSPIKSEPGAGKDKRDSSPLAKNSNHSNSSGGSGSNNKNNNTNSSGNSSNRAPLPLVSTPARDPASLASKRMQLHSPSVAGCGGIMVAESPMRTFGGPNSNTPPTHEPGNNRKQHQYDLTPRVHNTSAIFAGRNNDDDDNNNKNIKKGSSKEDIDPLDFDLDYLDMDSNDEEDNLKKVVTPDSGLHGEHLAFPQDLCKRPVFSARPMHPGAVLPPMASRGLLPIVKKSGPGWGDEVFGGSPPNDEKNVNIKSTTMPDPLPCTRAPELAHFPPMEEPVPFPPSGKNSYSFTCMKHYEKQRHLMKAAAADSTESPTSTTRTKAGHTVKPYQPSGRDVDVDHIAPEELDRIFTPRRLARSNNNNGNGDSSGTATPTAAGMASASTSQDDDEEEDGIAGLQQRLQAEGSNRNLFAAIPIEERQWSIPSIRMAHHVNGSVASFTTYTDEDDESLLMMYRDNDDASLSSLGSYSNHYTTMMLGGGDDEILKNRQSPFVVSLSSKDEPKSCFVESHSEQPMAPTKLQELQQQLPLAEADSLESEENDTTGEYINENSAIPSAPSKYHRQRNRLQRQEQRDKSAYEWLKTVTAGNDEVAEAASSKFLTGRTSSRDEQDLFPQSSGQRRPLMKRLSVTAGIESKTLAALNDREKNAEDDDSSECGVGDKNAKREDDNVRHAISADEVEHLKPTSSLAIH